VFAGAVRETVLSDPNVINRLKIQFVPVAIRAADLNFPGIDGEGQLIRTIAQSKLAQQGLCVLNSSGQALSWVVTFRDGKSVESFLDRSLELFRANPNGNQPGRTERYMQFPEGRTADCVVEPRYEQCSSILRESHGVVVPPPSSGMLVRLTGRALDQHGRLLADTLQQEHYVEHKVELPSYMQQQLINAVKANGDNRFPLPTLLANWIIEQAYLGQLDMQPLREGPHSGDNQVPVCTLYAQRNGANGIDIGGETEVSVSCAVRPEDGANYSNHIKLHWQGFVEFDDTTIHKILLLGRGVEQAHWESFAASLSKHGGVCPSRDTLVQFLPSGHPFSIDCPVVFGFEGFARDKHISIIPSNKESNRE